MLFCGIKKYAFKLGLCMLNSFYLLSLKGCITSIFLDFPKIPNLYTLNAEIVNFRICSFWLYRERCFVTVTDRHACLIAQSCLILCNSMDYGPPGSSIHGIFQARIPEWVVLSFSMGSPQPRGQNCISFIGRCILYHWNTWELLISILVIQQ